MTFRGRILNFNLKNARQIVQMLAMTWQAGACRFLSQLALETAQGVLPLISAWIMKTIFDFLAQAYQGISPSWSSFTLFAVLFSVVSIASRLMQPLSTFLTEELQRNIALRMQTALYAKISGIAGIAPFEDPLLHNALALGGRGAEAGPANALRAIGSVVRNLVTLGSFIGALAFLDWWFAALVGASTVPHVIVQLKLGRLHFEVADKNTLRQRKSSYLGLLLSSVFSAKEIRLLGLEKYLLKAFRGIASAINRSIYSQQLGELKAHSVLALLSGAITGGCFIAISYKAFQKVISLGDVSLFVSALAALNAALSAIIVSLGNLRENMLFFSRYNQIMALPQPITYTNPFIVIPRLAAGITVDDVSFRYSPDLPWILRKISLSIPFGRCVALVGANGAGKTTLVKLLARMYDPTEGRILWDGTDIRCFDPVEYRRRLGVIFQDHLHFDLSAYENIAFGDTSLLVTPDIEADMGRPRDAAAQIEVRKAASWAGIDKAIEALSIGYETILSRWLCDEKGGADLSGGEWQRMALARLFVRDASFLLLDEPTAALDPEYELEMNEKFVAYLKARTGIIVSHRFSTVQLADSIAVLHAGRIVEMGSHKALLARSGEYSRLFILQSRHNR